MIAKAPWRLQVAEMKFTAAAQDFSDAELQIRALRPLLRAKSCPAYQPPEPEVGEYGGPCDEQADCPACANRHEAWHARAKLRKVRGLARRRMLNWRSKMLLMLLCCLPALAQCRVGPSIALSLAAHGADAYSSYGRYELNPVLGRGTFGGRQLGIKLGGAAGLSLASWAIARRSQRACRWAVRLDLVQAGAIGAVAARNWRLR